MTCQAPLSKGVPRQEYWSGLPFPSPGDLLDPGIKPECPELQADSLPSGDVPFGNFKGIKSNVGFESLFLKSLRIFVTL